MFTLLCLSIHEHDKNFLIFLLKSLNKFPIQNVHLYKNKNQTVFSPMYLQCFCFYLEKGFLNYVSSCW